MTFESFWWFYNGRNVCLGPHVSNQTICGDVFHLQGFANVPSCFNLTSLATRHLQTKTANLVSNLLIQVSIARILGRQFLCNIFLQDEKVQSIASNQERVNSFFEKVESSPHPLPSTPHPKYSHGFIWSFVDNVVTRAKHLATSSHLGKVQNILQRHNISGTCKTSCNVV